MSSDKPSGLSEPGQEKAKVLFGTGVISLFPLFLKPLNVPTPLIVMLS